MSSSACAETLACVSSTKEPAVPLPKKDKQASKQLLTAFDGQDSLVYAAALDGARDPGGLHSQCEHLDAHYKQANGSARSEFDQCITAPHVPEQRPSNANPPCHDCPRTDPTSFANHLTFKFDMPVSFEYARQAAEQPILDVSQCPCGANSTLVELTEQVEGPTQGELLTFSRWPRLRDLTVPPPTVGDIASDPSGIADRYGVKGMSVLTAFVDMDDLSCRVCSFKAKTVQLAIDHQPHFQT